MSDLWLDRGESSIVDVLRKATPRGVTVRATGRIYRWKFDHVEARERVQAGEPVAAVARSYGVSYNAVSRVVDPKVRRRMEERAKAQYRARCEVCGDPCLSLRSPTKRDHGTEREICRRCSNRERTIASKRVRLDGDGTVAEVRCSRCRCWKPIGEFGRGPDLRLLREGGIANRCRACSTAARTEYRARHRVPCPGGCGRLIEGKGRGGPDRPHLCRDCWKERRKLD